MRAVTLILAVLLLAPSGNLQAQLRPGQRVRFTAPGVFSATGAVTVVAVGTDTLVVRGESNTWRVPIGAMTKLEGNWGRKPNTATGALVGLLVGLVAGSVTGQVIGAKTHECESELMFASCMTDGGTSGDVAGQLLAGAWGSAVGAAVGAAFGALIGASIKTERWEEVPLDRLRVSFAPQRDGRFALAASVRF